VIFLFAGEAELRIGGREGETVFVNVLFANAVHKDTAIVTKDAPLKPVVKKLTIFSHQPARGVTHLHILISLRAVQSLIPIDNQAPDYAHSINQQVALFAVDALCSS
jgi:hypothetical protein